MGARRATPPDSFSFAIGHAVAHNIYTSCAARGAAPRSTGCNLGDDRQHIDHKTRIEHVRPTLTAASCTRDLDARRTACSMEGLRAPAAQKTTQADEQHAAAVGEGADRPSRSSESSPRREVHAWRPVGRRTRVAFYMRARLSTRRTARELLTYAFAADVLEKIELAEVPRDWNPTAASLRGRRSRVPMSDLQISFSRSSDHNRRPRIRGARGATNRAEGRNPLCARRSPGAEGRAQRDRGRALHAPAVRVARCGSIMTQAVKASPPGGGDPVTRSTLVTGKLKPTPQEARKMGEIALLVGSRFPWSV